MLNNKVISIVGAGISGLSCALKLAGSKLSKGYTIRIFENGERTGGRAHSIKVNDFSIDLGAGRFSPVLHPNVSKLVNELAEKTEVFPFTKIVCPHPQHNGLKEILAQLKPKIVSSYNESFFQFLCNHLGNEKSHAIINGLGYDSLYLPQISPEIAYDIIEKHPEIQCFSENAGYEWFNLVDGFAALVKSLYERAAILGVEFHFEHQLVSLQTKSNSTLLEFSGRDQQEIWHNSNYTVLALPPTAMASLDLDFPSHWSDFTYGSIPLFKGFIFFDHPWWQDYDLENKVTIIDNPLRKLYFKSDKYIFFYTDSAYADFWHEETKKSDAEYINTVMNLISMALNIPINELPWPVANKFKYWPSGVEFAIETSPEHPPVLSKNNGTIIAASDAYTPHCGWMEGGILAGRNAADYLLKQLEKTGVAEVEIN
ncbi:flavin monoamine oxidase family protein [Iodobacter fluviatilis]|uniref:Monoamine oxidase n=1 Tax=Iodobacter fluviatilis TaxID=537 RepID=A0A377SSN4_9NEIS|nr:FAD-dependent oxidoreductase [Iodobacter fluviatilis]TCU82179.1 monoamine oxidase [Iodobacter fluviatilis]STR45074.1 Probable L-tryptophan oxidase VioA [Iodobacter fluviatilis]